MKARGIFLSISIFLIFASFFLSGCSSGGDDFAISSEKAITAYSVNGIGGTIDESEKKIAVIVPSLTNIYSQAATFSTTGAGVKVGATIQESGVTVNNFASPVVYTVTAADGSTVTYTVTVNVDRAWHNPTGLADNISPDGQDAVGPQLAMDGNGNAIIVWFQSDGAKAQIFKSEFKRGLWTNPSSLSDNISPDGFNAVVPQVAMDNNGNAIIVWFQFDGTNSQIFKSEYRNGAWSHPSSAYDNISPDGPDAAYPQVAMDNNGNAIIVWFQSDGTHLQIFKSEYRAGIWTDPSSLSDNISPDGQDVYFDSSHPLENPQVAMDNNGNAIIVWDQSDGATSQIFKSEYRGGVWTHPSSLSDNISPNGQNAHQPQVTMDNNGNAIIVWDQSDGATSQIFKSEYRNGAWTHPSSVTDNISPDGQNAAYPRVAMDDSGNAIIVWHQFDGANWQIFKSEFRNGSWIHPTGLTDNISPDGQDGGFPQVAMNADGNAIIVWQQYNGATYQIFKSEYKNGVWTGPTNLADNISTYRQLAAKEGVSIDFSSIISGGLVITAHGWDSGQNAEYPQVAMDRNGNAIISWMQSNSTNWQIFKSEYR